MLSGALKNSLRLLEIFKRISLIDNVHMYDVCVKNRSKSKDRRKINFQSLSSGRGFCLVHGIRINA